MQIPEIAMPAPSVPAPSKQTTTKSANETEKFGDKLNKAMANNSPDDAESTNDKAEKAPEKAEAELAGAGVVVVPVPVMIQPMVVSCAMPQEAVNAQPAATNLMKVPTQAIVVAQTNLAETEQAGKENATKVPVTQTGLPVAKVLADAETPKVETASVTQPVASQTTLRVEAESAAPKPVKVETQPAHIKVDAEEDPKTKVEATTNQEVMNAYAKTMRPEEPLIVGNKGPVLTQVTEGIKEMLQNGHTTVRLQIQPENLGRISMKLTSGAEGMQVSFTADKPSTQRLLENSLDHLRVTLQNAGVQLGSLSVGNQSTRGDQRGVFHTPKGTFLTTNSVEGSQEDQAKTGMRRLQDSLLGLNYVV